MNTCSGVKRVMCPFAFHKYRVCVRTLRGRRSERKNRTAADCSPDCLAGSHEVSTQLHAGSIPHVEKLANGTRIMSRVCLDLALFFVLIQDRYQFIMSYVRAALGGSNAIWINPPDVWRSPQ